MRKRAKDQAAGADSAGTRGDSFENTPSAREQALKEELESTNEELTAINAEMVSRNTELNRLNADLKVAHDHAEATVRTMPVPFVMLCADLRVDSASEIFYQSFHLSRAETQGRLIYDLSNRQWDIPKLRELLEDILPREKIFNGFEITHEFAAIGTRTMLLNARWIERTDGAPERIVLAIEDITERKRAEAALKDANRRKDEFLATLAHELLNPLAPIKNGLHLLRVGEKEGPTAERVRAIIERQLNHMVRLVDDLLDVSRITRGKIELRKEPVQLAAVVNSAVETSRPHIEGMGHELTVTVPRRPVFVNADLTRLAQVFTNLLNNAAKYSDRGGHIGLTVERQGHEVVVSVKDAGIGIAAEQLSPIFELFTQVDQSLDKSRGGLGIGLSLARRLVEMHGGKIEAKSEGPGKGSQFSVRLPVATEAAKAQTSSLVDESAVPKSSLRILIVDDNRDSADSLSMLLRSIGNDTRTAYDGQEGVDMAEEFQPDAVLLDNQGRISPAGGLMASCASE